MQPLITPKCSTILGVYIPIPPVILLILPMHVLLPLRGPYDGSCLLDILVYLSRYFILAMANNLCIIINNVIIMQTHSFADMG